MSYEKNLKLTGRTGDAFIAYPKDREDDALIITLGTLLPNGTVEIYFNGDSHQVWRSSIYKKGGMRGDKR